MNSISAGVASVSGAVSAAWKATQPSEPEMAPDPWYVYIFYPLFRSRRLP